MTFNLLIIIRLFILNLSYVFRSVGFLIHFYQFIGVQGGGGVEKDRGVHDIRVHGKKRI
jgi:hypothetical protein